MNIKETTELLEGIKVAGVIVKKALADGKINLADLPLLMSAVPKLAVLVEAGKGADQVLPELKDIDGEELKTLGAKVLEVFEAIKAA